MKYLIASNKNWHKELSKSLQIKTAYQFDIIYDETELTLDRLESISPQIIFFTHWSNKIPKEIFTKYECIIFHMTDLPFGRGGNPLQNLIIRGHKDTKLSALKCSEEYDAGPIYLKEKLSLAGTAEEILFRASKLMESMIIKIILEKPHPKIQKGEPTIFKRLTHKEGNLLKSKSLDEVFDRIRMLDADNYPPAFIDIEGIKLEFSKASYKNNSIIAEVNISKINE
jgi:methionyl-tRNA formyltransferase